MTAEQMQLITEKYFERRSFLLEYAQSSLHNFALAEEAVQQTFEIACRKIEDFSSCPSPNAWLTRTLSFVVRNIERQQTVENRLFVMSGEYRPDLAGTQEEPVPVQELYGSMMDMPQFRLLYELEVLDRPLAEVARELGISKDACRKRAERAKAYLRKKLENYSI